jgi:uncharacterized RDD family membrane protein YckC
LSSPNAPIRLDTPVRQSPFWRNTGAAPGFDFDRALFEGVSGKRVFAFLIDVVILMILGMALTTVGTIVGVLSFGILSAPLALLTMLLPLGYHTYLMGGPQSATFGMRAMGLEVRTWDGRRPTYLQAALQTMAFYVTVFGTNLLILLVVFFNDRRRTVHDMLCGTVILKKPSDSQVL